MFTLGAFALLLLVGVPGQYIREWAGEEDGAEAAAQATADIIVAINADIVEQDTLTVGARTYIFWAERSQPGEIAIGAIAALGLSLFLLTTVISLVVRVLVRRFAVSGGRA
jgi:hypothetical protein